MTLVIALAVIFGCAEALLRYRVGQEFEQELVKNSPAGTPSEVHFGMKPLALDIWRDNIPKATGSVGPFPQNTIKAGCTIGFSASNIDITDRSNAIIQDLTVTLTIPVSVLDERIRSEATKDRGLPHLTSITSITTESETNTLVIELNDGKGKVRARPKIDGQKLAFTIVGAEIIGIDASPLVRVFNSVLPSATEEYVGEIPDELVPTKVTLSESGLILTMSGYNVHMETLQQSF